ncbi:hypothetical protein HK405_008583, partial [Cladochytrium tenue]
MAHVAGNEAVPNFAASRKPAAISTPTLTYASPWPTYALSWSHRLGDFRLAVGSFMENPRNKVQVVEISEDSASLTKTAEMDHLYPPTK